MRTFLKFLVAIAVLTLVATPALATGYHTVTVGVIAPQPVFAPTVVLPQAVYGAACPVGVSVGYQAVGLPTAGYMQGFSAAQSAYVVPAVGIPAPVVSSYSGYSNSFGLQNTVGYGVPSVGIANVGYGGVGVIGGGYGFNNVGFVGGGYGLGGVGVVGGGYGLGGVGVVGGGYGLNQGFGVNHSFGGSFNSFHRSVGVQINHGHFR